MKRSFVAMLFVVVLFLAGSSTVTYAQEREGKVMDTTTVKNGVVTNWNCGCPQNGETNAFAVNAEKLMKKMNEQEMRQFMQLLAEFERVNGTKIQSSTTVQDHRTTTDTIKSASVGPMTGPGKQLCDFLKRFL
jgi:hypothetical protein